MKAPAFWYEPMGTTARLLRPLGDIYRQIGLWRRAFSKPYTARVPVLCVGNIVVGGSGKTPTALALARLLRQKDEKPAFVSRGYGGSEKGPLRVNPSVHTAAQVGDEPLLLAAEAPTFIARHRSEAVKAAEASGATVIIMDDGLQNPSLTPWASFLTIDGKTGLGNEAVLPAGPLREHLEDALPRVAAVIMIGKDERDLTFRMGKPVLQAWLRATIADDFPDQARFLAFAGIARPEKFFESCQKVGLKVEGERAFGDHHLYTDAEIAALFDEAARRGLKLLTTSKDAVRLPPDKRALVHVLPVRLVFEDADRLLRILKASMVGHKETDQSESTVA